MKGSNPRHLVLETSAVKVDFGGITMNGVNNPEEFVTELQKSKRFEKIVQSITVDTAMGKNSLGKYRF